MHPRCPVVGDWALGLSLHHPPAPLTLADRAAAYQQAFPQYPDSVPLVSPSGRWLNAIWLLGNNYRGSSYYGAYPPGFLPRVSALFPDVPMQRWLHLYSGSLAATVPGVRLDLRLELQPSLLADARALPFRPGSVELTCADPPYTSTDARNYGTPVVLNKPRVLRQLAYVTRPGGFLIWLDTTLPMYSKRYWHHFGVICIVRSTNHRVRLCSIFKRTETPIAL